MLFKAIYNAFIVCISIIALLLIISIFPITGNYKVLIVQSGSMEPAIKVGSLVVSKPVGQYQVGDIITFNSNQTLITHRLHHIELKVAGPLYTTKGDANNGPDKNKVSAKQVVGKVFFELPYIGYAVDAAKSPLGFLSIIVVPAAVIIYDEARKIWQVAKSLRRKKTTKAKRSKKTPGKIKKLSSPARKNE